MTTQLDRANNLRDLIERARRNAVEDQYFFVAYVLEMAMLALVDEMK